MQNLYSPLIRNIMKKNTWLLDYAKNIYSQRGEDGIIEKILEVTGEKKDWCVEFGAWDGVHLSNTHNLMQNGWSGVFIEGSKKRYEDLLNTYQDNKGAHCVCAFVDFEGENRLDSILSKTPIPKHFGVLSIDIDGNDYHIWNSLKNYEPRIVLIEFNPSIPPDVPFVQPKDMSVNQGSGLLSLVTLGKEKGYELICATTHNAIFVKKDLYPLFEIQDNSPEIMIAEKKHVMQVFQLYDGTIVFTGPQRMLWHGIPLKSFQPIPKIFRVFPSVMDPVRFFFFRIYRKLKTL